MRLQITKPDRVIEEYREQFCCPTSVSAWEAFIGTILTPVQGMRTEYITKLSKNICHRAQYLEFLAGLLFSDIEIKQLDAQKSLIHASVTPNLIHNHSITVNSILEGIGSYLHRKTLYERGRGEHNPVRVNREQWVGSLSKLVSAISGYDAERRREFKASVRKISNIRDRSHLDEYSWENAIDFHMWYTEPFYETHRTFKKVLSTLGSDTARNRVINSCLYQSLELRELETINGIVRRQVFLV